MTRTLLMMGACAIVLSGATATVAAPVPNALASASAAAPMTQEDAERHADALLAQMTIEEKAGQISQQFMFAANANFERQIRDGSIGSLLFVTDPATINRLQRIAVEETRLKIPLLFGYDVVHGLKTIFPVPIGMAASFDPAEAEKAQSVAANEARASGLHWTFAPMLDISRDARWGRMVESPGEDPYLGARMGEAQVRGFQGPAIGTPGHVIAGPKHFLGYAAAYGGRDYESVFLSDAEIHNVYLPPFRAAIEAGAGNVMSAYMDLNDIPASGNGWLLNHLLRDELGFKGWVVSDANAVKSQEIQDFAADKADAAVRAVAAGNDMEMSLGQGAFTTLAASVREGRLSEDALTVAAKRVLVAKFRMGLFDNPYVDEARAQQVLNDPAHRDTAQEAAERSLVLLKNDGAVLPLTPGQHRKVAVIGPLADSPNDILGSWAFKFDLNETVSLYSGIKSRLGRQAEVETAPGVELQRRYPSPFAPLRPGQKPWEEGRAAQEFERAVALARSSDLVILALGESQEMSGERAARSDLALPGDQMRLAQAVAALGKPVVLVLQNGRPLDITALEPQTPAILEAWYPGTRGGTAVARALFGDVNPGGKLPVTWPRSVGQVPIYYAHNTSQTPREQGERYWDQPSTPLYPFGYGLSYTTFDIAAPTVQGQIAPGGRLTVSTTVSNTGARAGDEVVQLYIHQRSGRASRPVRELKGFERVSLRAGESRTVSFTLNEDSVRYWNAGTRSYVIDPGVFDVWVGSSSAAEAKAEFTVSGPAR